MELGIWIGRARYCLLLVESFSLGPEERMSEDLKSVTGGKPFPKKGGKRR